MKLYYKLLIILNLVLLSCKKEEVNLNYSCERLVTTQFTGNKLEPFSYKENILFNGTEKQFNVFKEKITTKKVQVVGVDTLIENYKIKCKIL